MSWYGSFRNKIKERVTNLIKSEEGFEQIIQNLEKQPKELIKKMTVDSLLFDRSNTMDKIIMKLAKVEENNMKKHSDAYDEVGSDFYHDLLIELENVNQIQGELLVKQIENESINLELQKKEISLQKQNIQKQEEECQNEKEMIQDYKQIQQKLILLQNENSELKEKSNVVLSLENENQELKYKLEKIELLNKKYENEIQKKNEYIEELTADLSTFENENEQYKTRYFQILDLIQEREKQLLSIKDYSVCIKSQLKNITKIKFDLEPMISLLQEIKQLKKQQQREQIKRNSDKNEEQKFEEKVDNIENNKEDEFNKSIELSSLDLTEEEENKDNPSPCFPVEHNDEIEDSQEQNQTDKIQVIKLNDEVSISISESEEDEIKTEQIENQQEEEQIKLNKGLNLKDKQVIISESKLPKKQSKEKEEHIVKIGGLVINKKFLSNKQFQ